jgi:NAD+ diphosphatase
MTPQDVPQPPALARAAFDRAADERAEPGLVERLRADPASRVVALHGDRAPVLDGARLALVDPARVVGNAVWAFLGRDDDGSPLLVAAADADGSPLLVAAADADGPGPVEAMTWASLRVVGGDLSAHDGSVFVAALSLGRWLLDAPFCPRCGGVTEIRAGGWARRCTACGREHFPRTDPAVIVAVTDASGERLLLGKNALWADRNVYSTFAGFVEAGESLEGAITREVSEEAGVVVSEVTYRGSQAWPYPRSLMLGFRAVASDPAAARADGEEIIDVRWFTRREVLAAFAGAGDVRLPGSASIAHRLIRDWAES